MPIIRKEEHSLIPETPPEAIYAYDRDRDLPVFPMLISIRVLPSWNYPGQTRQFRNLIMLLKQIPSSQMHTTTEALP